MEQLEDSFSLIILEWEPPFSLRRGKIVPGGRLSSEHQIAHSRMHFADQELLTRLLDEHSAALVLYAQQWCDGPEDVVQEAFVQLMRQQPKPQNAIGWLYRVVRNGAVSQSRARGRRSRHEAAAGAAREAWFTSTEEDALDGAAAAAALESLSIQEREVIILRLWSGMSFE